MPGRCLRQAGDLTPSGRPSRAPSERARRQQRLQEQNEYIDRLCWETFATMALPDGRVLAGQAGIDVESQMVQDHRNEVISAASRTRKMAQVQRTAFLIEAATNASVAQLYGDHGIVLHGLQHQIYSIHYQFYRNPQGQLYWRTTENTDRLPVNEAYSVNEAKRIMEAILDNATGIQHLTGRFWVLGGHRTVLYSWNNGPLNTV